MIDILQAFASCLIYHKEVNVPSTSRHGRPFVLVSCFTSNSPLRQAYLVSGECSTVTSR